MSATSAIPRRRPPQGRLGPSFDEAGDAARAIRDAYAGLFERIDDAGWTRESERVRAELADREVAFGGDEGARPFVVDPVPRLIAGSEWAELERGLTQRVRALDRFLADAYGERRIVAEGGMPARVLDESPWYEPALAEIDEGDLPAVRAHVAGPDLVRTPAGELQVLEDNVRAPSGLTFALAARAAVEPLAASAGLRPRPLEPALAMLERTLRGAAPAGVEQPRTVLLSDGARAGTRFEHLELCRILGVPLATVGDLRRDGDRLLLESDGDAPVDVIYRRVDDERLTRRDGTPTELGELLIEPLRAGTLGVVNSPGSGIGDDKAVHTWVERMIRFYLGEEPLLRSVPGWDLGDPAQLAEVDDRLDELVLKPRSEFGGEGVVIAPLLDAAGRERAVAAVRADPSRYVAQRPVALSTHPTHTAAGLAGRHVDLRAFVLSAGADTLVAPGGLTRFARGAGEMVVNSGRGGGAKDTWIL